MAITCDVRECTTEAVVDIVPGIGGLMQTCDRHGADLLARDHGARVYPIPGQNDQYAIAVWYRAQELKKENQ